MADTQAVGGPGSAKGSRAFLSMPSTRLGWWSVGLSGTFVLLMIINGTVFMNPAGDDPWWRMVLPFYGIGMMGCGLAAGIVALVAVLRRHERSWLVFLPVLAGLFVVAFLLGEILVPH